MAVFPATPPTKTLFHGSPRELKGSCIHALTKATCLGDTEGGPYAFAGVSRDHALAYGLKDGRYHSSSVGLLGDVPIVIIGTDIPNYFDIVKARRTYVAEVSADAFTHGVFTHQPKPSEAPLEWVTYKTGAKIIAVETLTNDEVLQAGIQLVITDNEAMRKISRTHPVDAMRECLKGSYKPEEMWINLRAEYRNAPPWLMKQVGIASPKTSATLNSQLG